MSMSTTKGEDRLSTCKSYDTAKDALCDIRRVKLTENLYFLLNIFNLVFGALQIDDFNGDGLLCPFVVPKPRTVRWGAEQQLYSVERRRTPCKPPRRTPCL